MKLYIMMQSMNLDICFFKAKNNLKINKRQENVKNQNKQTMMINNFHQQIYLKC